MVFLFIISKGMHAETVALANYCVASNTMIGALFYNLFDNTQDGVCHSLLIPICSCTGIYLKP